MTHEITRVLRAFSQQPWFIEPRMADQMIAILELRAAQGPRAAPYRTDAVDQKPIEDKRDTVAVLNLMGPIVPRSSGIDDLSGPTVASLERFSKLFDQVAADDKVTAIVLNIDSPGGSVDLVPELAAKIRAARRPGRPIVAVANTLAASAAYWLASAADELVVSPSGEVGSIGVYMLHQDQSEALKAEGVHLTFIAEGPRKTEGNPFEPLGAEATAALRETTRYYYDLFVKDVARNRGVSVSVVRADPEKAKAHFGGGRVYPAQTAVRLGMADRVDSLEGVLKRLQASGGSRRGSRRAEAVPVLFSQVADADQISVYACEPWPEVTLICLDLLAGDPGLLAGDPGCVTHDIDHPGVVSFRVANGWARYVLDEDKEDGTGSAVLTLLGSDWTPPPDYAASPGFAQEASIRATTKNVGDTAPASSAETGPSRSAFIDITSLESGDGLLSKEQVRRLITQIAPTAIVPPTPSPQQSAVASPRRSTARARRRLNLI